MSFLSRIEYCLCLSFLAIFIPQAAKTQTIVPREEKTIQLNNKESLTPLELPNIQLNLPDNFYKPEYLELEEIPEQIPRNKIKIIGNSIFSELELASLTNLSQNSTVDRSELAMAILRINLAYRDRGYLTSGIFTAPQLRSDGNVTITVTEGEIEKIKIAGLNRLKKNYLRKRLNRNLQPIFNRDRLESALQLLQLDPLISDISAQVNPGSTMGKNVLEIEVQEADPFYLELSLDNLGDLASGSFRRQIKLNHDNLFGFGDRIYAAYTNTDGRNSLDSLNYTFPINSRDGKVAVSYGFGKLEAIEEPIEALDIDLNYNVWQIFFHQPIYQTPQQEFALGLGFSRTGTETTLFGEPFALNRGASFDDEVGELNVSEISFYQDYTRRGRHERFDLRSQLSFAVDLFDATDNGSFPANNFFIWRGHTSYLRKATSDVYFSLKSYWQLSDRELVFTEQSPRKLFVFDREEEALILRGYARNSLAADNYFLASAELQANVLKIDSLNSVFQLTPFIDFGTAGNKDDVELDESTLISTGLGIRLLVGESFRARVDWGIPLIERDLDRGSLQEDGITFNIEYRPF